jgi:cytochrome b
MPDVLAHKMFTMHPEGKEKEDTEMTDEIRVWDPLVRIFHWSLVLTFTIGYLTGEEESNVHIYAGYAVLGLIMFRVVWGLVGTRYARFGNFLYSPGSVIRYLSDLLAKKPKHYLGHNPAGGAMVIAMLLCLFVVSWSGLKVYAIEEGLGPLAGEVPALTVIRSAHGDDDSRENDDHGESENGHDADEEAEEFWEEIHEVSSNVMLFLVFLHIAGVIVSSRLHHENLVKAMFTGKKVRKVNT